MAIYSDSRQCGPTFEAAGKRVLRRLNGCLHGVFYSTTWLFGAGTLFIRGEIHRLPNRPSR